MTAFPGGVFRRAAPGDGPRPSVMSRESQRIVKMDSRKERRSLRRDAVMRGNDLPLAANLHPYVGQAVVVFVRLTFGIALLVIGAGDNGGVPVETNFEIGELRDLHVDGGIRAVRNVACLAVDAAVLNCNDELIG